MPQRIPRYVGKHAAGFLLVIFVFLLVAVPAGLWRVETIANDAREIARENTALVSQGQRSFRALTAIRDDLCRRVNTSREFLDNNPSGTRDFPAAVISKSIRDQARTIDALNAELGTDCPTEDDQ